jgi:hypothetical protein
MPISRVISCLLIALTCTAASAYVEIDLSDFDKDLMRNMDDAVKALDTDIVAKDNAAAAADARFIIEGLSWAESYFAGKGTTPDAVKWAKEGHGHATAVATATDSNDFDAAFTSYRALVKTCRSCHDVYKSPAL